MFELVFYLGLFLSFILGCVIVVAKFSKPPKYKLASENKNLDEIITFGTIMVFLESQETSYEELQSAARELFDNYEALNLNKIQKRTFIYTLSKHPNARSGLILSCLNRLKTLNPELQKELDRASNMGLDQR